MANHRADGRAHVRKRRLSGGTHCEAALPAGVVKVGVLGALATATIAAPLAAAAAGVEDAESAVNDTVAAAAAEAPVEAAAVELPVAADAETREDEDSSRAEDRESTDDSEESAEEAATEVAATEVSVEVPEPEPEPAEAAETSTEEGTEGESAPASSTGYIAPVNAPTTSGYGYRTHPVLGTSKMHDGLDYGATCGTPVKASAGGTVVAVETTSSSGNRVKIDHGDGVITGYYHLQGFNTSVGATVAQGDTIGYVGNTGRSTGCHLHFAKMDASGNYSDPTSLLR